MKRKVRPDVVAGGSAIDLGDNFYLMKGKTHKQGGIDIGKNPRTGIEVENNEIVQVTPNNVRVFSAQPILHGISPAQALLNGGNPQHIFAAQEAWKQVNRVTDDGRKFGDGGYTPSKEILDYIKKTEAFRDKWYKDGNGIDTIGYGFTGEKVKKLFPNGITREQADKYFADSIAKRAVILARDTPNWDILSQNQRDALLSYHYNIGEGSYRNKHKNLQKALQDKDWETAILNIDAGYNDKKNPGLRKRRDYERELFRSGSTSFLTGDEEKQFRDWYDRYSRSHDLNPNPDKKEHYYDYRGYWKNRTIEQANDEWKLDSNLPDTYNLPGHPTFSTQSRYSTRKTPGGTWKKVGLGPVYDEEFVDSNYTKRLKTFKNATYAMGGEKRNGQIEPSFVTAKLPAKFNGSQAAARRYAEGYKFGKRVAEKRDKTAPYILAAANAPMLIEGMAVAPLATLGSLGGGYVGNKVGTKVGGPIGGIVGGLIGGGLGAGVGVGTTAGLKQLGKYGNGVLDRLAESIVRVGDNADKFDLIGQLTNKNAIKYILNPKAKDLAYKMPYKYSGTDASMTDAFPGDVVDQFFGKYPVPNATYDYSVLPKGMQRYIAKNYPNKRIPIRDLKDIVDLGGGEVGQGVNMREVLKDFNYKDEINVGGSSNALFKRGSMETVLDPGGFNAYLTKGDNIKYNSNGTIKSGTANIKGVDIWKFKPSDYIKRYNHSPINLLSSLGLKFIDSRGTPIVHTFEGEMPFYIGEYKYGGIHIKPSKRGTFTAAAKRHHMSVQEFARKVLNNRANYSDAMVKKANFARNAAKWHKKEFGGDMTKQFYITPNNIYKLGGDVRPKAILGKQTEEYERYYDNNGRTYYRIGNTTYNKDGFARQTGMTFDEIDAYFDSIESQGTYRRDAAYAFADPTGHIIPSIITADRQTKQPARPVGYRTNTIGFNDQLTGAPSISLDKEQPSLPEKQVYKPIRITGSDITDAKFNVTGNGNIVPTTRFNINDIVGSNQGNKTPIQSIQIPPVQFRINTTGRPTIQSAGFAQIRPYDGRSIETNSAGTTPTTTPTTQGQRRNNNSPTRSSVPAVPELPIDYDTINKQIDNSNNRILSQTLNSDILTPITGKSITPASVNTKQGIIGSTRAVPKNPYYSKFNVGLHKVGRFINDNPDLLGLGINWAGNAWASLINRSAIKGMRYPDAPIPLRAEKLPTKVNVNPQVSEIKENIAGQERLIKDNTASSTVSLARRQKVRNAGSRSFQSLMGEKSNTELQLLTADKLNRQGVDNQNVTNYTRWREGLYDFNNKKREMLAENDVAGINNAAEAFAGPEGYLARKEARNKDVLNMGLIAATSPNAQKVIGSKEFEEFLRKLGYRGKFSLLDTRFNG